MGAGRSNSRFGRGLQTTLGALCLLLVAGCQSRVETRVSVSRDAGVAQSVVVVLEEDAASATLRNIEEAKDALGKQAGVAPEAVEVSGDEKHLELRVEVPESMTAPASGLADVRTETLEGGRVRAVLRLSDGGLLKSAVKSAVSSEKDAGALEETIGRSLEVCVSVRMPGSITSAVLDGTAISEASDPGVNLDGRDVHLCRVLEGWRAGDLVVESGVDADGGIPVKAVVFGVFAVVVAAFFDRRRRLRP